MGLKEKLLAREATLGVIGLGYVGLPLAVEKAKAGFKVYGFDVQKEKVDMVNAGKNYIGDVVNEDLEALVKAGQLGRHGQLCRRGEVRLRVHLRTDAARRSPAAGHQLRPLLHGEHHAVHP